MSSLWLMKRQIKEALVARVCLHNDSYCIRIERCGCGDRAQFGLAPWQDGTLRARLCQPHRLTLARCCSSAWALCPGGKRRSLESNCCAPPPVGLGSSPRPPACAAKCFRCQTSHFPSMRVALAVICCDDLPVR